MSKKFKTVTSKNLRKLAIKIENGKLWIELMDKTKPDARITNKKGDSFRFADTSGKIELDPDAAEFEYFKEKDGKLKFKLEGTNGDGDIEIDYEIEDEGGIIAALGVISKSIDEGLKQISKSSGDADVEDGAKKLIEAMANKDKFKAKADIQVQVVRLEKKNVTLIEQVNVVK